MSGRLADVIIRYRWLLLAIGIITVFTCSYGVNQLGFTTDYQVFFDKHNEQLNAYEKMQNTYDKSDNVLIAIHPKSNDVFQSETLNAIQWLTHEAWQTPYSTRVDSVTNFQHTEAEDDDLLVIDLVAEELTLDQEERDKIKQIALSEPLLVNRIVSQDGRVTAVNITIKLPGKNLDENSEVANFAYDLKARFLEKFPQHDVYITGVVMLNQAFQVASQKDMTSIMPLMFIIILIALVFTLRSISMTVATLIMIIASIATAMGMTGWLGIKITPPSSTAPTIIMTMAVADAVHILVTYLQQLNLGSNKVSAMRESIRINLQPVFLTSLTTIVGFLSMNFSDVPPFHDLGNIVALGVSAAFIFSITILPALAIMFTFKPKKYVQVQNNQFERVADFVINQRKPLLWGLSLFTLITVAFLPKNELNDEWVQYFDKSIQFRNDTDFVLENLTGLYVLEVSLESGQEGGVSEPDFLQKAEEFASMAKLLPEVLHVSTFTDTMNRLNKNMHNDAQEFYRLPQNRELAAQYLLLYEMSLPFGLDLNNQINVKKSATRIVITTRNLSTNETIILENKLSQWLNRNAADYEFAIASPALMFAHIGERNTLSMLVGASAALVIISFILMIALRSIKMGIISLVPNIAPAFIAFGIWGILVSQVGMGLAMVAGMTLGIVVDNTVHFLSKYTRAQKEKAMSTPEAIHYAFANVGKALVTTTIVLVLGFTVMSFSAFSQNADMGILTALTISIALIIDFLLLPALLLTYQKVSARLDVPVQLASDTPN
ncbi:efflux RND transporter permease subunit [Aliikangiella maris]|uniref:MMPL family transporter n=2 Tax=Aliikangiella maris TaxID=3162458 RepID=A0ABV3MJ98_9GAMM